MTEPNTKLPDEDWLLAKIQELDIWCKQPGETVNVPRDRLAHIQSILIGQLGSWRDAARLNWLDSHGASWRIVMSGKEVGRGHAREAINQAILAIAQPNAKFSDAANDGGRTR